MNVGGIPRSLMWRDLRAVSRELAEELAPAAELWLVINKGADPVKITLYTSRWFRPNLMIGMTPKPIHGVCFLGARRRAYLRLCS